MTTFNSDPLPVLDLSVSIITLITEGDTHISNIMYVMRCQESHMKKQTVSLPYFQRYPPVLLAMVLQRSGPHTYFSKIETPAKLLKMKLKNWKANYFFILFFYEYYF